MIHRPGPRALTASCCVAVALLVLGGCSGGGRRTPPAARAPLGPATASGPHFAPGALLAVQGIFLGPIAVDRFHLVWETSPLESQTVPSRLVQRDLRSGRTVTLVRHVDPLLGLASTSGWVVYVSGEKTVNLFAMRHDGSHRVVLTRSLAAPVTSRGELVAWAEDDGTRQRVVVRDMARGVTWVASEMPRCVKRVCHRIDAVTLAEQGVVFTLGAIGPAPSYVVRQRFSDPHPERTELPGDPQPDLAPSAAGALYYALRGGWFRWDFGTRSPSRVPLSASPTTSIVAYEAGALFLLTQRGCSFRLRMRLARGKTLAVASPSQLRSLPRGLRGDCVQLVELVSTGAQPVTAWHLFPSGESHAASEKGKGHAGILLAGKPFTN